MKGPSRTNPELIEEISALKQRIKELEQSETDRKVEALQESEERFRAIADYTYNWENWIGPDGKLVWINPAVSHITGYSVNECLAMNDFPIPLFDETDRERMTRLFTEVVQGASCSNVEFRIRCKDGNIKWGEVSCQPIYNANRANIGHRSSIRDITSRKKAEEALQEAEEKYRNIFENSDEGLYRVNPEGRFVTVNSAAARILGYESPAELISSTTDIGSQVYAYPEDRDKALGLLKEDGFFKNFEVRNRKKDGSIVWVSANVHLVRDDQGNILYHEGTSKDITDRKQAEEALNDSEKKYRTIVENTNDAIYIHDFDGNIIDVNENACRMVGYTRDELVGDNLAKIDISWQCPENAELEQLIRKGSTAFERENVCKDGSVVPVEVSVKIVNSEGKGIIQAFVRNITERKRAEEELKQHRGHLEQLVKKRTVELTQMNENLQQETNERNKIKTMLKGILDSLVDHISMIGEDFNIMWANEIGKELFGKNIIGRKCYAIYHGRKVRCNDCAISRTFRDGQVHEHETETVDANGNTLYFWCTSAVASRYPDGRVKTVLEVSRDISKRKLAEMALKKSKEDLETKSKTLEELNTALRVLLRQREEDKKNLEDRVVSNMKRLVIPYIEKMKKDRLNPLQHSHLSILETNLNEIVSPFLHTILQLNLTPRETQIASLIKDGKTTKEIAGIIGVATSSIDTYRNNIRSKLGLNNKKVNLQSYLQSLK